MHSLFFVSSQLKNNIDDFKTKIKLLALVVSNHTFKELEVFVTKCSYFMQSHFGFLTIFSATACIFIFMRFSSDLMKCAFLKTLNSEILAPGSENSREFSAQRSQSF